MTTVREMMTPDPVICAATDTWLDAARIMRDHDIGDVLVQVGDEFGLVTDRDLVVRGIAQDMAPANGTLGAIASMDLKCVRSDDELESVVRVMRERKVRRVPVFEDGWPVGILSIGDLAVETDAESALAEISGAAPNN